jgi:hypothetical protein
VDPNATRRWHLKVKLHGLDLDLETLKVTNHKGSNDRAIATLDNVRRDVRETLAALPAPPLAPPQRVSVVTRERTFSAIVESAAEAAGLLGRWAARQQHGFRDAKVVIQPWQR